MDKKSTVLIVDDSSDSLFLLMETLTAKGYTVRPADSGELALSSSAAICPDLILLDMRMPDMDGLEVCRRLKSQEETRAIPIIMMTAASDVQDKREGFRLGAVDYITKPFQPEELLARVKTHLEISILTDELQNRTVALEEAHKRLLVDIAKREQTEEVLKQSEAKLSRAQAIGHLGSWEYDTKTGMTIWSDEAYRIFGFLPREVGITTDLLLSVVHPEDKAKVEKALNSFSNRSGQFDIEYRIIRRDGSLRYVHSRRDVAKEEAPDNIFGMVQDITDRKQAEEKLRESNELFSLFMHHSPIYTFIKEVTPTVSRVLQASENYQHMIGIPGSDMAGKTMEEMFAPEFAAKITADDWTVVSQGDVLRMDEELNGRSYNTIKFPIVQGGKTLLAGYTIDITDRKRAEEENRSLQERLQRSEKMEALGQLAGGVAHDLNNVLGILSGYSELLLDEIPEGNRSRGHVEKILQSTEKGAAIIQDLLTLARRGVTATEVLNLNHVVSGFMKSPVLEKIKNYHPRVTFRTECDENLLNMQGSPVHLDKVLMNLVSNAAEAISGEGSVTVRTESRYLDKTVMGYDEVKEGDYVVLTVSDTGMGIPAEDKDKIFEPFYSKKKLGRSGTGLGLAIVWGTVKDHHGYIDLQSEVGKGTTFTLYFPVTREELTAQQQKEPIEQYLGNGEKVLVVDDIAEQREIATRLLTRLGYAVHAVGSGEEAVAYLQGSQADILVLDMIMAPGIDGWETYQRILKINPHQKAIIVSGFSETDRVKELRKLGAGAYVKKPYAIERIGIAIRNELSRK